MIKKYKEHWMINVVSLHRKTFQNTRYIYDFLRVCRKNHISNRFITVYITTLRFLSLDETGNAIAPQQVYACAIVLVYFSRVPKRLMLI